MQSQLEQDRKTELLLFFLVGDPAEGDRAEILKTIEEMSASRQWVLGPPRFVDTVDHSGTHPDDLPIVTIGGALELYSASAAELSRDIDRLHLEEVECIVDRIQSLSAERNLEFEFELDGQYVGTIDCGNVDDTLAKGLIEEWRNHINASS
ncbi:hypothetical protein [Pseudoduganella chitinolytica]|uniref:Uncharacterized protein n=1 Tax=Pseudoduganella chitinolytica TaxID=34070 RepID=A0ABY8BG41_9BURK|nr:hypothetical protein [Pseudoduganella chitinolytica]WEF33958.1 hypothetical protein PX653_04045 [Pseudoduganella chitinolytica]